ncbi:MAG TPA: hypothetical protein VEB20_21520 [Azospirillaceae bacterium]|nr:hypothetical protein [Azospirillaceae bacterium]
MDVAPGVIEYGLDFLRRHRTPRGTLPDTVLDRSLVMPHILPWTSVLSLEEGGRPRVAWAGAGVIKVNGFDGTGRFVDELLEPRLARQYTEFVTLVRTSRRGHIACFEIEARAIGRPLVETLFLPVEDEAGEVRHQLLFHQYNLLDGIGVEGALLLARLSEGCVITAEPV